MVLATKESKNSSGPLIFSRHNRSWMGKMARGVIEILVELLFTAERSQIGFAS
jgi:hypothetical protein